MTRDTEPGLLLLPKSELIEGGRERGEEGGREEEEELRGF